MKNPTECEWKMLRCAALRKIRGGRFLHGVANVSSRLRARGRRYAERMSGHGTSPQNSGSPADWPGRRLGLPATGPRSVGRLGRRTAALCIDWALCTLVSIVFYGYSGTATLIIFALTQIVFVTTMAGGTGHLIVGLRVVTMDGKWLGFWRPLVRTLLLCLVIPAVIWDRDQRGMHDRLAGTVVVRR